MLVPGIEDLPPSLSLQSNNGWAMDVPNVSNTKSKDPVDQQVIASNHPERLLAWTQCHWHWRP